MRRKIVAGNWKMNGSEAALQTFSTFKTPTGGTEVIICPPAPLLNIAVKCLQPTGISIGAQDCHPLPAGAHTGDISARLIADTGARYVILGHSERRNAHAETDRDIADKVRAAWAASLTAIVCIGETQAQRDAGTKLSVIDAQLSGSLPPGATPLNTIVAYEPTWAIGTGMLPTLEEIATVHDAMRAHLAARFTEQISDAIPLLYGGSVKPENASAIFQVENVDGALVGGASLTPDAFAPIVTALSQASINR
ncbi:MAG: triose-phosphate isomerase [Pseudomonadota bacterium]